MSLCLIRQEPSAVPKMHLEVLIIALKIFGDAKSCHSVVTYLFSISYEEGIEVFEGVLLNGRNIIKGVEYMKHE